MKSPLSLAIILTIAALALTGCRHRKEVGHAGEHHKIVLTKPKAMNVTVTQQYVCQIHSRAHIEVCALQDGYLEEIFVKEGQPVRSNEIMFKILPTLYQARLAAERAEAQLAQIEFDNTKRLFNNHTPVVSQQEVALAQAKLDKANAKARLAEAELEFTNVRAPFDGIVDRLLKQRGSLIEKKDVLTTLSDNTVMWVYFNVPESRYLEYIANAHGAPEPQPVELVLANGSKFRHAGQINAIEAKFNNETGNIPFRADFPNPERQLRHGQTGNVLIHRTLSGAIIIPQRATFEVLDKRYVYVVDTDDTVRQRLVTVQNEQDDIFLIKSGLGIDDRIVLEGVRQVHEGQKLTDFEFRKPEDSLANQKHHAE